MGFVFAVVVAGWTAAAPSMDVPAVGPVREFAGPPAAPPRAPEPFKPRVFPRSSWDSSRQAAPAKDPEKRARIIVHHTANRLTAAQLSLAPDSDPSREAAAQVMRATLREHRVEQGWTDIAYHYMIDWDGRVWEARPLPSEGAHAQSHNRGSIGVAVMGNWDLPARNAAEERQRRRQLAGLEAWLTWLAWQQRIPARSILGHHEYNATACPGRHLARTVQDDAAAQQRGEEPSPLRAMRLRIQARLEPAAAGPSRRLLAGGGALGRTATAAISGSDPALWPSNLEVTFDGGLRLAPRVLAPLNGRMAQAAAGSSSFAASYPRPRFNTTVTPAAPAPPPKPASVDDGKYRLPFASQQWPGVPPGGKFGAPRDYGEHTGLDLLAEEGTPVHAARPGRVTFVDTKYTARHMRTAAGHRGYGNRVVVEHPDGSETWYCHLGPGTVNVKPGDAVTRDSVLGAVGQTGSAEGPHLHFMVINANGDPRNPEIALGHARPPSQTARRRTARSNADT